MATLMLGIVPQEGVWLGLSLRGVCAASTEGLNAKQTLNTIFCFSPFFFFHKSKNPLEISVSENRYLWRSFTKVEWHNANVQMAVEGERYHLY